MCKERANMSAEVPLKGGEQAESKDKSDDEPPESDRV